VTRDLELRYGKIVATAWSLVLVVTLALWAIGSARGATATAVLRAHLTPDALATWQAQPDPASPPPELIDAALIDNHNPAAVSVSAVAVDAIVSASWTPAGIEIASDGTAQAVLVASEYVIGGGR
jgi:hypothetical protein